MRGPEFILGARLCRSWKNFERDREKKGRENYSGDGKRDRWNFMPRQWETPSPG